MQDYRAYDFDHVVEQLTRIWANALGIKEVADPLLELSRSDVLGLGRPCDSAL